MEPGAVTRCSESRGRADCWRYARMASIVPACARFQVTLYPGSECPRIFITLDRLVGGQRGGEINWAETCVTCIVLLDLLLGGTFGLRRWPTPLGPPTDLMPGHLSPARGRTTLNATHLRAGQVADPAPSASWAIVSSTSARPSTPVVLRAWSRSLLGGQALGSGEAMGRVAGGAEPTQQLGGLQRHGTNYYRRAVAIRCRSVEGGILVPQS